MRAIRRETHGFRRRFDEQSTSEVAGLRLYLRRRTRAGVAELRKTSADPIWGILWAAEVRAGLRRFPQRSAFRRDPETIAAAIPSLIAADLPGCGVFRCPITHAH